MREGALVTVEIRGKPVFYQLTNGLTKEEVVTQTNERGFVVAEAEKVGTWDDGSRAFHPTPWLPPPYAPVFMRDCESVTEEERKELLRCSVGIVPGTKYPVVVDPHRLVTHNTAILGILGVGKSTLARELIHRILKSDVKVLCIDPTGEYVHFFDGINDEGFVKRLGEVIDKECLPLQNKCEESQEKGGSLPLFRERVAQWVAKFIADDCDKKLVIVNPLDFTVTRQSGFRKNNEAPMSELTAVEITRVLTEACLEAVRGELVSEARLCVVFEEAHSLIPEWNSVAADGDKTASTGTARAILQGRKHGLGCILITQRTANVTKSILNQCNTVFAMRIYDSTGAEFLSNYIGPQYSGVLSSLPEHQAVVFGRGSSSPQPLIVQLNHPEEFKKAFYETEEAVTTEQEQPAPEALD